MRHRVLMVGGNAVERGRLEGSLRNGGVSAMPATDVAAAILLCRQFGPSAILLLEDPGTETGRSHVALLQSHPATATTPLLTLPPASLQTAMAVLHIAVAFVPAAIAGVDLVALLDTVFGDDPRDLRRRPAWHRRGPGVLRRLGDHLRQQRGSGVIAVQRPAGGPAWVRIEGGRLLDAVVDGARGVEAIKTLLADPTDEPWGFTFVDNAAAATAPVIVAASVVEVERPAPAPPDDEPLPADIVDELPVDMDLDLGLDDALDDALVGDLGLPPLPTHVQAPPRLTILLVDDDPALVTLYGRTFSHVGHTVHTANDGEEGYAKARQLRPDVIVSDIDMPRKNGWDLLAAVRGDPRLAETPFLLLSCHGDFLRGLSKARAGADDYIEKGIRAGALKERLEAAAAARSRLTTWQNEPPPSFRERLAGLGIFGLMATLERTRADGAVIVDDGWTKTWLWLVGGQLILARTVEPDGTTREGIEAVIAALWPEADVEFRSGEAPPEPGVVAMSPAVALEEAARVVEQRRRESVERALAERGALHFREAPTTLFLLIADEERARLVRRLVAGEAPRDLLESGTADPLLVEWVVQEVIAKGLATVG